MRIEPANRPSAATYTTVPVSYTHLDVYKRQVLQEGSTDLASFPTDEEVQAEARRWLEDAAQKPPRRWPFARK